MADRNADLVGMPDNQIMSLGKKFQGLSTMYYKEMIARGLVDENGKEKPTLAQRLAALKTDWSGRDNTPYAKLLDIVVELEARTRDGK